MPQSLPIRDPGHYVDPAAWRPVRTLWVGGLCTVEEVVLQTTGQHAVLKHMHAEHLLDPGIAARCLNEALILRLLHRDGAPTRIPRLVDLGLLPSGCPCVLMELLGISLAEQLAATRGSMRGGQQCDAVQIGQQMAQTLAYLHARGVVHRDVRPENILFAGNPRESAPKSAADTFLIDFGLAKTSGRDDLMPISTGDEDILGTDEYMAPEQWDSAKKVTGAADVYSLGIVLYQLTSGRLPFRDPRRQVLLYQHLVTPPEPLPGSVPRALARLIHAMLAKRSADRPSATECANVLRSLE